MIEQILPGGVATAEAFVDPPGLVPHPSEEALIGQRGREAPSRVRSTTRHLARQAMGKLGVPLPLSCAASVVPRCGRRE